MASDHRSRSFMGWLAGCGAATAVFAAAAVFVAAIGFKGQLLAGGALVLMVTMGAFVLTCVLTGIPAAIVVWVSEQLEIHSVVFFGGIGAVIGVSIPGLLFGGSLESLARGGWIFLLAGLAAGITYWRVAGRYAGRDCASASSVS